MSPSKTVSSLKTGVVHIQFWSRPAALQMLKKCFLVIIEWKGLPGILIMLMPFFFLLLFIIIFFNFILFLNFTKLY